VKVTIDGVDYEMPVEFAYDEMGVMKRVSGLTHGELYEALDRKDSDTALAFAACVLFRENPALTWQEIKAMLGPMKVGKIILDFRPDPAEPEDGKAPKDDAAAE
jgi:hypothetical protein